PTSDRLKITRGHPFRNPKVYPERMECRLQTIELLLFGFTMNTIQRGDTLPGELLGDCDVRHDHAFFNQLVRVIANTQLNGSDALTRVDNELCFRSVKIQCTSPVARFQECAVHVDEDQEPFDKGSNLFPGGR